MGGSRRCDRERGCRRRPLPVATLCARRASSPRCSTAGRDHIPADHGQRAAPPAVEQAGALLRVSTPGDGRPPRPPKLDAVLNARHQRLTRGGLTPPRWATSKAGTLNPGLLLFLGAHHRYPAASPSPTFRASTRRRDHRATCPRPHALRPARAQIPAVPDRRSQAARDSRIVGCAWKQLGVRRQAEAPTANDPRYASSAKELRSRRSSQSRTRLREAAP